MVYRKSDHGIGEMLNSPEMEAGMRFLMEKRAKPRAEQIAPYDPTSTDGTHYRDRFRVESGLLGGYEHDRAFARLLNDDPAALWIELGTSDTPKHRTLGKAIDSLKE